MKYCEAKQGRIFIIRLEDGDVLHECIESFARTHSVARAALIALGGADKLSKLVVGPGQGRSQVIVPMETILDDVHEVSGTGTLFPNTEGEPVLHMHMACGRNKETVTGCVRRGVKVWHVMEVIMWELSGTEARRLADPVTGFELLIPSGIQG